MKYYIYNDGKLINTIVADENFCKSYCCENGYTYRLAEIENPPIERSVDPIEQLRADIDYIAIMKGVEL